MQLVSYVMATKLILYSAMTKKFKIYSYVWSLVDLHASIIMEIATRLQILMRIIIPNNNLMMNMKTVMQPPKKNQGAFLIQLGSYIHLSAPL